MNFCDLHGKSIVVTGASSGLGRATCLLLDKLNATVCLIGRNEEELNNTVTGMNGDNHLVLPFDLCHFEEYSNIFKYISDTLGRLHGVVHFAGIRKTLPVRTTKIDHLRELFDINLYAFIEIVKNFTKRSIVSPDGASIIAVSSVLSLRGAPAMSGYGSSKAAVDGSVRSLACELAPKNIRVNSIAPGHVETEMNLKVRQTISEDAYNKIIQSHPLGIGHPSDVANIVAFLISDESRWITGATIPIDGGFLIRS